MMNAYLWKMNWFLSGITKFLISSIFLLMLPGLAFGTHQRAGEITYRHLFGLTYEVTILTYTFSPSPADRPELVINWGDGLTNILPRSQFVDLPNDIRRNVYVGQHTYNGPGAYMLSMEDPNRNYGVINIPNSVNVPLYIETLLIINPFLGPNNSAVLTLPPIDNGCANLPYLHNPGAYDPDGDSLSYRLVTCRGTGGLPIPGYTFPPATNSFSLDSVTGDLLWDSPPMQGEYNVAILIEEWRNGVKIGSIVRDMQIIIVACNQDPPVIAPLIDTCVEAGTMLTFTVTATDVNNDLIQLIGTGAPMNLANSPAYFDTITGVGSVSQQFSWQTICPHVRKSPYLVYFKATDNGSPVNLVDIANVRIQVISPGPKNLVATPLGNRITLYWDPTPCNQATGYDIYRRTNSYGFIPGHCETGVPAYTGYQKIASVSGWSTNQYEDDGQNGALVHGQVYCYMVVATFSDGAESYASNEACATLKRDVPIITHVSVLNTSTTTGRIKIAWDPPTELDFLQTPGPFRYRIMRGIGANLTAIDSLDQLTDTLYIDTLLNTLGMAYRYQIDFINLTPGNVFQIGSSSQASSVYVQAAPTDQRIQLSWTAQVPWSNQRYDIYRWNLLTLVFDSIASTTGSQYTDTLLTNGQEYCYKVLATGSYSRPDITSPLLNWSQETCATPLDNEPPCAPYLEVTTNCEIPANVLTWNAFLPGCPEDIASYELFYAPRQDQDPVLISRIDNPGIETFTHTGAATIAGCYLVVAIDSLGNRSLYSNKVCIDIDACERYRLPNVFTPNGDGVNDLFVPFPYSSVEKVDMIIYNRWGSIVYKTENPDIEWNGNMMGSGQACSDGVYYYVCEVFEITLNGPARRSLQGVIHLMR